MNEVFWPYLQKFILVFINDIWVYSQSYKDHLQHLEATLVVLRKHKLFSKQSKCRFGSLEVKYLDHVISTKGVKANLKKLALYSSGLTKNFEGLEGIFRPHWVL